LNLREIIRAIGKEEESSTKEKKRDELSKTTDVGKRKNDIYICNHEGFSEWMGHAKTELEKWGGK